MSVESAASYAGDADGVVRERGDDPGDVGAVADDVGRSGAGVAVGVDAEVGPPTAIPYDV